MEGRIERPFVKRVGSASLAQSEDCAKTPEEINLVRKIDQCTHKLFQSLNATEDVVNIINKQLLPLGEDGTSGKEEKQEPQGWLEKHLDFLLTIYNRSISTHGKVLRLEKEIKTNKVGQ